MRAPEGLGRYLVEKDKDKRVAAPGRGLARYLPPSVRRDDAEDGPEK